MSGSRDSRPVTGGQAGARPMEAGAATAARGDVAAGGAASPSARPAAALARGVISVSGRTIILQKDIREEFIRASGPGGQNVNKVSTAVQLWFDLAGCQTLAEPVKERARSLAGSRLTLNGEIQIQSDRFRTRERNRADALDRLLELLRKALVVPKTRKATRPTLGSKKRRLDSKKKRGAVKKMRSGPID